MKMVSLVKIGNMRGVVSNASVDLFLLLSCAHTVLEL